MTTEPAETESTGIEVGAGPLPDDPTSAQTLLSAVRLAETRLDAVGRSKVFRLYDPNQFWWDGWAIPAAPCGDRTPVIVLAMTAPVANTASMLFAFVLLVDWDLGYHRWPVKPPPKQDRRKAKQTREVQHIVDPKKILHGFEVEEVVGKALSYLRQMIAKHGKP